MLKIGHTKKLYEIRAFKSLQGTQTYIVQWNEFSQNSPRRPCAADSRSTLGGRRSGCVCPWTCACLPWCPWRPLPPLAGPGPRGGRSPGYTRPTGRSAGCGRGSHGNPGRNTGVQPNKNKTKHFVSQTQTEAVEVVFHRGRWDLPWLTSIMSDTSWM